VKYSLKRRTTHNVVEFCYSIKAIEAISLVGEAVGADFFHADGLNIMQLLLQLKQQLPARDAEIGIDSQVFIPRCSPKRPHGEHCLVFDLLGTVSRAGSCKNWRFDRKVRVVVLMLVSSVAY
jgi:hypothetical protein